MLIVGLVAAMAAAAGADEKPLWTANFAEGGNVFVMRHVKREVVSADQIRFPERCSHVEVREFPAFEGAVRLSFKARYLNRNEHNPMQFIDLVTTSGAVFHYIMYNQNGISHSVKTALGSAISGSYKTNGPSGFEFGPDAAWHTYTFDFGEHSFASRKNATVIDSGDISVGVPKSFKFAGIYGCEVKDFVVTRIPPPPKPRYAKKPTFEQDRVDVPFRGERLFPVRNVVNASAGGILFWARPNARVELLDADKRMLGLFEVFGGCQVRAQIVVPPSTNTYDRAIDRSANRADNAWHYAFTWDEKGRTRLFLNGLPYGTGFDSGSAAPLPMDGNRLADARWIRVTGQTNGIEKLVVYSRPVPNRDVLAHYRERMPVDLVFANSVVPAGTPTPVTLVVAPGGAYTKPNPVEPAEPVKGKIDLELRVEQIEIRHDNKQNPAQITSRKFIPFGGVTVKKGLSVDRTMDVSTDPVTLPPGEYRLVCDVTRCAKDAVTYRRSLYFSAARPLEKRTDAPTTEKWKGVETLFDREFRSDADFDKVAEGPRYYQVVSVPPSAVGQPCLLSVTWPDDQPRSFGLYWYPEGGCGCRDRLQAGIQAGHEIPNSGKLQTAEYLVYPSGEHALLEVRTMVAGWDAKVTHVKLERLATPLPRLKVNLPKGLPARRFGNTDEDQTFYNNFNADVDGSLAGITDRVAEYLGYTGQDRFHYSVARYSYTLGPVEGSSGSGMYPRRQGGFGFAIDRFAAHGIGFVGKIALNTTPLFDNLKLIDCDYRARGYVSLDREGLDILRFGAGKVQINPANPEARKLFLDYFDDVIARHARAYADLWYDFGWGVGPWGSLNQGYDDWTVGAFVRESGKARALDATTQARLKRLVRPAKDSSDYLARWEALTSTNAPSVRAAWLRWRADRVTDFTRELVTRCRRDNPALRLFIQVSPGEESYVENGIDLEAVAAIDGVHLATTAWAHAPRANVRGRKGSDAETVAVLDAALAKDKAEYLGKLSRLREICGSIPLVMVFENWCETPGYPPREVAGHRFVCSAQASDVKYHGRYFLRPFAQAVGFGDAQEIVTGGLPVGSLGSEEVVREFVRAYRALPALPFRNLKGWGEKDGAAVVGRGCKTENGVYFYFVNLTDRPQAATAPLDGARDLSTDETLAGKTVELKPYELRSFLGVK